MTAVVYCLRNHWTVLLLSAGHGRGPHFLSVLLDHHGAVVPEPEATHPAAVGRVGVGVPHGLFVLLVHHQVAVVLHAQTPGVALAGGVRVPHGLPAVDDEVTVLLDEEEKWGQT